jgi:hypothetical protein
LGIDRGIAPASDSPVADSFLGRLDGLTSARLIPQKKVKQSSMVWHSLRIVVGTVMGAGIGFGGVLILFVLLDTFHSTFYKGPDDGWALLILLPAFPLLCAFVGAVSGCIGKWPTGLVVGASISAIIAGVVVVWYYWNSAAIGLSIDAAIWAAAASGIVFSTLTGAAAGSLGYVWKPNSVQRKDRT